MLGYKVDLVLYQIVPVADTLIWFLFRAFGPESLFPAEEKGFYLLLFLWSFPFGHIETQAHTAGSMPATPFSSSAFYSDPIACFRSSALLFLSRPN